MHHTRAVTRPMRLFTALMVLVPSLALLPPGIAHAHGDRCDLPFQSTGDIVLEPGFSGSVAQFPVPAGHRLQIEQVSASIRLASNLDRGGFSIATTAGGTFAWHLLPAAVGMAVVDWQTAGPVALYADAGTDIRIAINRNGDTSAQATGTYALTGCLYPVP